ncbi:16195_t:CDS:2 [Entrophospora sp. SA101]|nr:16195_t:CDS:2 [Entrophospora sp. SA101]
MFGHDHRSNKYSSFITFGGLTPYSEETEGERRQSLMRFLKAWEIFSNIKATSDQRLIEVARKWESEAYDNATSKEDYDRLTTTITNLAATNNPATIIAKPTITITATTIITTKSKSTITTTAATKFNQCSTSSATKNCSNSITITQQRPESLNPQQLQYYQQLLKAHPSILQIQRPPTTAAAAATAQLLIRPQLGHPSLQQQNVSPQLNNINEPTRLCCKRKNV